MIHNVSVCTVCRNTTCRSIDSGSTCPPSLSILDQWSPPNFKLLANRITALCPQTVQIFTVSKATSTLKDRREVIPYKLKKKTKESIRLL